MRDYAFGNLIAALRSERGFSQFQLGRLLGVSDKAVSKWENGNAKPRLSTCCRLAEILGVSVNELLSPSEQEPESGDPEEDEAEENLYYCPDFTEEDLLSEMIEMEEQKLNMRMDTAEVKRAELHTRTNMSMSDGIASVGALMERAAEWGMPAAAVTDFCTTRAFPHAVSCRRGPQKIILGCEGFMLPFEGAPLENGCRIMLLASSREGLVNLNHLVSLSCTVYLSGIPCIPREILLQYRKGLLFGCSCEGGELAPLLKAGAAWEELMACAAFYDYLEVQPVENELAQEDGTGEELRAVLEERIRTVVRLGHACRKPVAAVSNARFLDPEDALARAVLQYHDGFEHAEKQAPYYLRTTGEMLASFAFLGEEEARQVVIDATLLLAGRIEDGISLYPKHAGGHAARPFLADAEERLRRCALSRAHELYGQELPPLIAERLEKEFRLISAQSGWTTLDIARMAAAYSLDQGYPVGSRGTVGSSLTAFLLGVCRVNPLPPHYVCPSCQFTDFVAPQGSLCGADLPERACPHCKSKLRRDGFQIPMETFLGAKGEREIDIDLNLSPDIQESVHAYICGFFGQDHVFRPGTVSVLSAAAADQYVSLYAEDHPEASGSPMLRRASEQITSAIRTAGQHPGGLLIVPPCYSIDDFTPVGYLSGKAEHAIPVSHYDYYAMHDELLKMDFLGHNTPTLLRLMQKKSGVAPEDIPLGDRGVLGLFLSPDALGVTSDQILFPTGTAGIADFETPFMQNLLLEIRPASVEDLIRTSALAHGSGVWVGNVDEIIRSKIASVHECPATRDDITNDLIRLGVSTDTAFAISEMVRKGKGCLIDTRPHLADALESAGLPEWYKRSLEKIVYLFPRAHAADYVSDALRLAWYKLYHPEAFYSSWLRVHADGPEAADLSMTAVQLRRTILSIRMSLKDAERAPFTDGRREQLSRLSSLTLLLEMKYRGCTPEPL